MRLSTLFIIPAAWLMLASCTGTGTTSPEPFWLGADVSTANGMAERGAGLLSWEGDTEYELIPIMKEMGLNAVRFRVWVNPRPRRQNPDGEISHAGLCDKEDVLANCLRAKECGMEIMLCFHYSDSWADPKKQPIPQAWSGHPYEVMRQDLYSHTSEVLQLLKDNGISVKWIQIGNETRNGLLWNPAMSERDEGFDPNNIPVGESMGHSVHNPEQYAGFIDTGYQAAKSVYPEATVIVHLDNGYDSEMYDWNLGILEKYKARYDMVGMSLYPYWAAKEGGRDDADQVIEDCMRNVIHVWERFGKESMIVETGFLDSEDPEVLQESYRQFSKAIRESRENTHGHCKGIFYWAPESRPGGYSLGAWGKDGRPSLIMKAFRDN